MLAVCDSAAITRSKLVSNFSSGIVLSVRAVAPLRFRFVKLVDFDELSIIHAITQLGTDRVIVGGQAVSCELERCSSPVAMASFRMKRVAAVTVRLPRS